MTSCAGSVAYFLLGVINLAFIFLILSIVMSGYHLANDTNSTTTTAAPEASSTFHHQESVNRSNSLSKNLFKQAAPHQPTSKWDRIPLGLLIFGIVFTAIPLFGFCAVVCDSRCMLNFYVYILVFCTWLIFIVYLVGTSHFEEFFVYFSAHFTDFMTHYYSKEPNRDGLKPEHAQYIVDLVQRDLFCCGNSSSDDWRAHSPGQSYYPSSCCIQTELGDSYPLGTELYLSGCFSLAAKLRYGFFWHLGACLLLCCLVLLLAISCCLERNRQLHYIKLVNNQYFYHMESCEMLTAGVSLIQSRPYHLPPYLGSHSNRLNK